ncbi:MAG: hypothetical protein HYV02_03470 [Deltaproteobacteria bacterium]|nr:hypothetical protein [Deltaproteobacteria bacterium]
MKWSRHTVVWTGFLLSLCVMACANHAAVDNAQRRTHQSLLEDFHKALLTIQTVVDRETALLLERYDPQAHCASYDHVISQSSFYVPKSAVRGTALNCLAEVTAQFDEEWKALYERTHYISWMYVYDNATKATRLYPQTNTYALFGPDMAFESFYFYHGAVAQLPHGVWSGIRDDINGTGKIVIYSKALKCAHCRDYLVVAMDLRLDGISDRHRSQFVQFEKMIGGKKAVLFAYYRSESARELLYQQQSLDMPKRVAQDASWEAMGDLVDMTQLAALESSLGTDCRDVVQGRLTMTRAQYVCTMGCLTQWPAYMALCREE